MTLLTPVLLSGGSGSRLWPLSRQDYPKQLLPLVTDKTLLQETALRFTDKAAYTAPLVICNEAHRFAIAEQLLQERLTARIILEPTGKNTAPAAAIAALLLMEENPDALILLAPSDHVILHDTAFHQAAAIAAKAAAAGHIVTFGIQPTFAETGYGYIHKGEPLQGFAADSAIYTVQKFIEKPVRAIAEEFLAAKTHLWNAGIFAFAAKTFLEELKKHAPEMIEHCKQSLKNAQKDLDFIRLEAESFNKIAADSIDYAVMEKTTKAAVVQASQTGWSDVGSWGALYDISVKNSNQNVSIGDVITENTTNCYIRASEKQLVATVGVENLVIVATADAILIAHKNQTQDVKILVDTLKKQNRSEAILNRKVHRPWGSYEALDNGERYQVKRLVVKPQQKLSLQKHFHRAEHWVVTNGTALVHRDGEEILLQENESVYLPLGCVHRLENVGKIPLVLVEVQSGSYLGEDDIVRFEDTYGRVVK
jgi:mannose-1-phosphate guanylyltransferase/mannose-6-phosphate isomerase